MCFLIPATFPFFYNKKRNRKISEQFNFIAQIKKMRKNQFNIFNPWVGKIPWRRKWLPTPVFLPGKSHGQRTAHVVTKSQTRLSN